MDKPQDIGVRNVEDTHIRAAPDTALFYHFGRLVDDIHKTDRPRGHTASGIDHRARGPQEFIGHAGAAARLVNNGHVLRMLHDPLDRIGHAEHKAGGELALGLAGVDEAWGIRDKFPVEHNVGHRPVKDIPFYRLGLGTRDVADHPAHDIGPGFERFTICILERVAFGNDLLRIKPQRGKLTPDGRPCAVSGSDRFTVSGGKITGDGRFENYAHRCSFLLAPVHQTLIDI